MFKLRAPDEVPRCGTRLSQRYCAFSAGRGVARQRHWSGFRRGLHAGFRRGLQARCKAGTEGGSGGDGLVGRARARGAGRSAGDGCGPGAWVPRPRLGRTAAPGSAAGDARRSGGRLGGPCSPVPRRPPGAPAARRIPGGGGGGPGRPAGRGVLPADRDGRGTPSYCGRVASPSPGRQHVRDQRGRAFRCPARRGGTRVGGRKHRARRRGPSWPDRPGGIPISRRRLRCRTRQPAVAQSRGGHPPADPGGRRGLPGRRRTPACGRRDQHRPGTRRCRRVAGRSGQRQRT